MAFYRNVARDGPSARVAYSEESALTAALKRGSKADGTAIFYPYEGTTFNSCEEAREFYNLYSWEIGFGIRYGRSNKNRNVYNKAGYRLFMRGLLILFCFLLPCQILSMYVFVQCLGLLVD